MFFVNAYVKLEKNFMKYMRVQFVGIPQIKTQSEDMSTEVNNVLPLGK
jgi:hypothetical protein